MKTIMNESAFVNGGVLISYCVASGTHGMCGINHGSDSEK